MMETILVMLGFLKLGVFFLNSGNPRFLNRPKTKSGILFPENWVMACY
jgi:hypothetical protein